MSLSDPEVEAMVVKGVDIPEMTEGTHAHRHIERRRDI